MCKLQKKLKVPSFHCQKFVDQKDVLRSGTSKGLSKSIMKMGGFFIRFLTIVI